MKFEYDEQPDKGECVAFIDNDGDLCMKNGEGIIYLTRGNASFSFEEACFESYMVDNGATKKFYPGDKITITF